MQSNAIFMKVVAGKMINRFHNKSKESSLPVAVKVSKKDFSPDGQITGFSNFTESGIITITILLIS